MPRGYDSVERCCVLAVISLLAEVLHWRSWQDTRIHNSLTNQVAELKFRHLTRSAVTVVPWCITVPDKVKHLFC